MAPTQDLYLDLMKRSVMNTLYEDPPILAFDQENWGPATFDLGRRRLGGDIPSLAFTMIGEARLDNIRDCLEEILRCQVPGDLIETGVWRGGACIFMRAMLKARGVTDRVVWAADAFGESPMEELIPSGSLSPDLAAILREAESRPDSLRLMKRGTSLDEVRSHFHRYGLLDEQVRFLKGPFARTLPSAPVERLAMIRLDGDYYDSTLDALVNLYPKLSVGGYVIVDDYVFEDCRRAVESFRSRLGISDPLVPIDCSAVYWKRESSA